MYYFISPQQVSSCTSSMAVVGFSACRMGCWAPFTTGGEHLAPDSQLQPGTSYGRNPSLPLEGTCVSGVRSELKARMEHPWLVPESTAPTTVAGTVLWPDQAAHAPQVTPESEITVAHSPRFSLLCKGCRKSFCPLMLLKIIQSGTLNYFPQ